MIKNFGLTLRTKTINKNSQNIVYNGPRTSNLTQQQQKNFGKKWFLNNKIKKNFLKIVFLLEKNFFWKKLEIFFDFSFLKNNLSTSSNYTLSTSCINFKSFRLLYHSFIVWYHTKKVKKPTRFQKRGLATTVQHEPDFSRTWVFRKVLGINKDCLNAKFHRIVRAVFEILTKTIKNGVFIHLWPPNISFFKFFSTTSSNYT